MTKKIICLTLVVFMFASVFVGCGTKEAKDTVTIIRGSEPRYMDPCLNNAADSGNMLNHLFEGLMRFDKDGNVVPGMAKEYKISDDGTKYTFTLRDAKWSDGEPVTAQDFEYSWKRVLNPETASEYAYYLYYLKNGEEYNKNEVTADDVGVKAVDEKTLEVELKAPTGYFLSLCAFSSYFPVRKDIIEKYGVDKWYQNSESYICNGPYTLEAWNHDSDIVMTKNDNYWDNKRIKIKKLKWVLTEDQTASLNAWESGEVDVNYGAIPTQEIKRLLDEGTLKIFPNLATYYLGFNVKGEGVNDAKIRRALALAIDRKRIVEKVTQAGQVPAVGLVPYDVPGIKAKPDFRSEVDDNDFLPPTPNVEEAKKLLAEAGYPNGEGFPQIEIIYNTSDNHQKIMEAVQEDWKKNLGIDVKVSNMEWAVLQDTRNQHNFQVARDGWGGDYLDPMTFLDLFITDGGNNTTQWGNDEYDALIKKAQSTADNNVRMKAMHKAEKILMEEMPICPLYFYTSQVLINDKVKGIRVDVQGNVWFTDAYID